MTTLIPDLVTIERPDTFVYRSSGLPDVKNGFVRKPALPFIFKVKDKVGREGVFERQVTRLATAIRVPDARHHIDTFAFGEVRPSPPGCRAVGREISRPEYFSDRQIGIRSSIIGQISR